MMPMASWAADAVVRSASWRASCGRTTVKGTSRLMLPIKVWPNISVTGWMNRSRPVDSPWRTLSEPWYQASESTQVPEGSCQSRT